MKLKVLFVSRSDSDYPEALACMTEHDDDDAPEYLQNELLHTKRDKNITGARIVDINLGNDAVDEIMKALTGTVEVQGVVR